MAFRTVRSEKRPDLQFADFETGDLVTKLSQTAVLLELSTSLV